MKNTAVMARIGHEAALQEVHRTRPNTLIVLLLGPFEPRGTSAVELAQHQHAPVAE